MYMNRRVRPSNITLAVPQTSLSEEDAVRASPATEAQCSSVFLSPMSTTTTTGRSPTSTAGNSPQTKARGVNGARNVKQRPATMVKVTSHGGEDGDGSLSASSSSLTVHRRPSLEARRRSSAGSPAEMVSTSPTSPSPPLSAKTFLVNATAAAAAGTGGKENHPRASAAPAPATTTIAAGSTNAAAAANAAPPSEISLSLGPLAENGKRRLSAPTSLAITTGGATTLPDFASIGSRQMSYQTLESPQNETFLSDLSVSREGVDWERVDADPQELFRQRNKSYIQQQQQQQQQQQKTDVAAVAEMKSNSAAVTTTETMGSAASPPSAAAATATMSAASAVVQPSSSSKSNEDDGSLNCTQNTIAPDSMTATPSRHDTSGVAAGAAGQRQKALNSGRATKRTGSTVTKKTAPALKRSSPPPPSQPTASTSPASQLRRRTAAASSVDSSMQTDSAALDVAEAIDVRVAEETRESSAQTSGRRERQTVRMTDSLPRIIPAEEAEEDEGENGKGGARHHSDDKQSNVDEIRTTANNNDDDNDKSKNVVGAAGKKTAATSAHTPAAMVAKDGEVNIFVAVRLRPCSGVAEGTPTTTKEHDRSCVRVDARRGYVDCSTVVPASVLGGTAASTGNAVEASSGLDALASGGGGGGGKQLRTLRFSFDHILDDHTSQRDVMEQIGQRAVERVLAGYHGTVMCYGQSGSGKTYTMVGPSGGRLTKKALRWRASITSATQLPNPSADTTTSPAGAGKVIANNAAAEDPQSHASTDVGTSMQEEVRIAPDVGLLPRMLHALFSGLEAQRLDSDSNTTPATPSPTATTEKEEEAKSGERNTRKLASWSVTFSALELYNEELRDLLPRDLAPAAGAKNKKKKKPNANAANAVAKTETPAGTVTSPIRATPIKVGKPPGSDKTPTRSSRHPLRAGTGPGSPSPSKKAPQDTLRTSKDSGHASFTSFPTYPGLFNSLNGGGTVASGTDMDGTRCWDAEDLEVLNAVSSSDHDDDDDESDSDSGTDSDGDTHSSSSNNNTSLQESSTRETQGGRASSGKAARSTVQLSPSQPQRDTGGGGEEDEEEEPDPSRPTLNDGVVLSGTSGSPRGRVTIGQLTSVSPSLSRPSMSTRTAVKKPSPAATDTQDTSNLPSTAAAAATNPATITTVASSKTNGKTVVLQSRVSRRLPNTITTTTTASKSPSPLQKSTGVKGSNSPAGKSATGNNYGYSNTSYNNNNVSGGSQLVIRQGQPPSSPTATASSSVAADSAFALSSPFKSAGKSTSTKSRSSTRTTHHHHRTIASSATAKDVGEAVYIEGLREHPIRNLHDAMDAVRRALRHRQMGHTELNSDSSRAHTFFFIRVEQRLWRRRGNGGAEDGKDNSDERTTTGNKGKMNEARPGKLVVDVRRSTLTLVDLAGSERVSHTGAHGLRLKEAQNINLSLSALGNVMRLLSLSSQASTTAAAATPDTHIPYRDSKLTRILQSSLGGNAITFLLCNASPDRRDASETLSTLRFAKLSKAVKNNAKLNESIVEEDDPAAAAANRAEVEKYKEKQQAALSAALAAQGQVRELTADATGRLRTLQQLTTYTWWLEEQLGYFVNCAARRTGGGGGGGNGGGYPTVVTLPTSLTNADSGTSAGTAPTHVLGELRSGGMNSSVGPLSDTERQPTSVWTTNEISSAGAGPATAAGPPSSANAAEEASCSGAKGDNANWWRLSPRPSTPPAQTVEAASAAAHTGHPEHEEKPPQQRQCGQQQKDELTSPLTPPTAVAAHARSAFTPLSYWQSPPARTFLSASYAITERQGEMQRRLIAAATAAGLTLAPATAAVVAAPAGQYVNFPLSQQQQQQQQPNATTHSGDVAAAAGSYASVPPSAGGLISPFTSPANPPVATYAQPADGKAPVMLNAAAPAAPASPSTSRRESMRAAGERQEPAEPRRLGAISSVSGVFVSESSMADMYSPCLSILTDAQSPMSTVHHPSQQQQQQQPQRNFRASISAQFNGSQSAYPSSPSTSRQQQQQQQQQMIPMSNFAVALAEERRAREAVQAQLCDVEEQNILLRLRLAALQAQQQQLSSTDEAGSMSKLTRSSDTFDGSSHEAPKATAASSAAVTKKSPTTVTKKKVVKRMNSSSNNKSASTSHNNTNNSTSNGDHTTKDRTKDTVQRSPLSDTTPPSLLTPSSPPHFQWPPHYSQLSAEASLETFLARCGFVRLDPAATAASSLTNGGDKAFLMSPLTALAGTDRFDFQQQQQQERQADEQQKGQAHVGSYLSSPSDPHSQRSITVNPTSLQILREGSAPPGIGASGEEDNDEDADTCDDVSTAASSVLAVVNAVSRQHGEHPIFDTPARGTSMGRVSGSTGRRVRKTTSPSPESTPRSRSPGWGQQLLANVRTTLETVRALSSHEHFYEPDDINVSEREG